MNNKGDALATKSESKSEEIEKRTARRRHPIKVIAFCFVFEPLFNTVLPGLQTFQQNFSVPIDCILLTLFELLFFFLFFHSYCTIIWQPNKNIRKKTWEKQRTQKQQTNVYVYSWAYAGVCVRERKRVARKIWSACCFCFYLFLLWFLHLFFLYICLVRTNCFWCCSGGRIARTATWRKIQKCSCQLLVTVGF